MPTETPIEVLRRFHGHHENDEIEVKSEMITMQKLAIIITSFMNGSDLSKKGHIFIGIREDSDEKIDSTLIKSVQFPLEVKMEEGKRVASQFFDNIDAFTIKLKDYLTKNTSPRLSKDLLDQLLCIELITEGLPALQAGEIIMYIQIQAHEMLVQFNDKKYYARLPKLGSNDFESQPMDQQEFSKRFKSRLLQIPKLSPLYSDTRPAIPELKQLFDCVYQNKMDESKELLKSMPSLTQMVDSGKGHCGGNNILMIAVMYHRLELIKFLHEEFQMSLYSANNEGQTPLLLAAYIGNLDIIKYFLEKDRHVVHQRDRLGNNLLLLAGIYDHIELVEYLLSEKKFLLDSKDYADKNILEVSAYGGAVKVVQSLLQKYDWPEEIIKNALAVAKYYEVGEKSAQYVSIQKLLEEKLCPKPRGLFSFFSVFSRGAETSTMSIPSLK